MMDYFVNYISFEVLIHVVYEPKGDNMRLRSYISKISIA
jgi:hypothetical protein